MNIFNSKVERSVTHKSLDYIGNRYQSTISPFIKNHFKTVCSYHVPENTGQINTTLSIQFLIHNSLFLTLGLMGFVQKHCLRKLPSFDPPSHFLGLSSFIAAIHTKD